jgi:hypothetical protein
MLPNLCPSGDRTRLESDGATVSRNRSKRSTRNPKAIIAMAVRTQARNVRSFAAWFRKFLFDIFSRLVREKNYYGTNVGDAATSQGSSHRARTLALDNCLWSVMP